jgi:nitrate/TMAO reductase-like tetraheme cytochrome c subunit
MKKLFSTSRAKWITYSTSLVLASGLILLVLMIEVSSQPQFCGGCHIMAPYFQSWKTSSHQEVPCVDCHIPPGIAHEAKKKWEAMSMVVSYITGTYGTNPWAEIDDAACLRCHERRLLLGQEVFGDVLFDHTPHLTEMRHGKKLRCTSCHSQIVQGSHIAVTTSTCILCHFEGSTEENNTSRCTLCHQVPDKLIQKGMLTFDHSDVGRLDMQCEWCHAQKPGELEGRVPRERCFTCHNEAARMEEYEDTTLMHRTHVSDHKVDCMNCHLEIQHGKPLHKEAHVEQTQCSTCHAPGHSAQSSIYSGTGGRGVEPMPAPMFLAGVSCEGCHFSLPGKETESAQATDISCMSCHGPRYRSAFYRWIESSKQRTDALRRQLQQTQNLIRGPEPKLLQDARHNLQLVESGRGAHNVRYAFALLEKAHDWLNQVRTEIGGSPLPSPWPELKFQSECMTCHQGVESQKGTVFGRLFSHEKHVVGASLLCDNCHRTHEEKEKGEVLRFGIEGCSGCHHTQQNADCTDCHSGILQKPVASFRGDFDHSIHSELVESCVDCHSNPPAKPDPETCAMCH